jgi:hypothetical protein
MRVFPVLRRVAAATLIAGLVACEDGTGPSGGQSLDDALEDLAAAELFTVPGVSLVGGAALPSAGSQGCTYDSDTEGFTCADVTSRGITISRSYQLLDANGDALSEWGPSVHAIHNLSAITGTIQVPGASSLAITVDATEESTLSGLNSATQRLQGTGSSTTGFSSPDLSFTSHNERETDLTLPSRGSGSRWPTGTVSMTSTSNGVTSTMTITYDGTSVVQMETRYGNLPAMTCTYDLALPGSQPSCN